MPVFDEIITKAFNGNSPFLTNEAQILFLEYRLNDFEALLHFAPIGEQRQHRPLLRDVRARQKPLELVEIMRVGRLWNVVCHIYRHILVEVVARIKLTGAHTRILACVQPHRVFKRSEIPVDGQRCRSKHDRFRLRVQLVFKSLAHINDERLQLIRLLVLLSAQLRSVSVAVRLLAEDRPRLLPRGLSNPSRQRRFRAGAPPHPRCSQDSRRAPDCK